MVGVLKRFVPATPDDLCRIITVLMVHYSTIRIDLHPSDEHIKHGLDPNYALVKAWNPLHANRKSIIDLIDAELKQLIEKVRKFPPATPHRHRE